MAQNSKFSDYRLVNGAEEIIVKVETSILTKEAKSIRIDAESYSVARDSLKNIVTKKFDSLTQKYSSAYLASTSTRSSTWTTRTSASTSTDTSTRS